MRLVLIFCIFYVGKVYGQKLIQKPLQAYATKQETMDWIGSKFKFHYYKKTFTVGTDDRTYDQISYENNKIIIREHINWKAGFGPEKKFYYYILDLNRIEKVEFNPKTGRLVLLGKNIQEMEFSEKSDLDRDRNYLFQYFNITVPIKAGEVYPIFYEASPWLLKSLATAFEKMAGFNKQKVN